MSQPASTSEPLDRLISAMLDGTATTQEQEQLAGMLKASQPDRQRYIEAMMTHALLRREIGGATHMEADKLKVADLQPSRWRIGPVRPWIAAAAVLIIGLGLGLFMLTRGRGNSPSPIRPTMAGKTPATFPATLPATAPSTLPTSPAPSHPAPEERPSILATDAEIHDAAGRTIEAGMAIGRDEVTMGQGTLRIAIDAQSRVVVHGPAQFTFESRHKLLVKQGRMMIRIEPGSSGLIVKTAAMSIRDIGTEFGVIVSPEKTEVHVFMGKVEATPAEGGKVATLVAGTAMEIASPGAPAVEKGAEVAVFDDVRIYPPVEIRDATVSNGRFADQNSGKDGLLSVRQSETADFTSETYMNFDLAKIKGKVKRARLSLFVESSGGAPDSRHAAFLLENAKWDESTITWKHQRPGSLTEVARWSVPASSTRIEVDVTTPVRQVLAQRELNLGLRIKAVAGPGNEGWARYYSRENHPDYQPRLEIETQP